jgi:hypothetical protein
MARLMEFEKEAKAAGVRFPIILEIDGHQTHFTEETVRKCHEMQM